MRIEFAEVKKIPIAAVLRMRRIEMRESGRFLIGKCPLPTHKENGVRDSFKVNVPENWWVCFSESCRAALGKKGGDVIDLVKILDGVGNLEAGKHLASMFALNQNAPREAERNGIQRSVKGQSHNKPLGFTLQADPCHPMIQSRGISIETAAIFGIGYYENKQGTASMHQRIIFPLTEPGIGLVGYAGRRVKEILNEEEAARSPKWLLGKGLVKSFL